MPRIDIDLTDDEEEEDYDELRFERGDMPAPPLTLEQRYPGAFGPPAEEGARAHCPQLAHELWRKSGSERATCSQRCARATCPIPTARAPPHCITPQRYH